MRSPNELTNLLTDLVLQEYQFRQKAVELLLLGMETYGRLDEIYEQYAVALDRPLTDNEKKQALLTYILEDGQVSEDALT